MTMKRCNRTTVCVLDRDHRGPCQRPGGIRVITTTDRTIRSADPRREARIETMAHAGRELAKQWGHPDWSECWSRQVAEAMLDAKERIDAVLERPNQRPMIEDRDSVMDEGRL